MMTREEFKRIIDNLTDEEVAILLELIEKVISGD